MANDLYGYEEPGKKKSTLDVAVELLDILNTVSYIEGGAIESAKTVYNDPLNPDNWKAYSYKDKIAPSKALAISDENTSLSSGRFWIGLGVDIALDPTTYLSGGAGASTKLGKAGTFLNKAGQKEFAGISKKIAKISPGISADLLEGETALAFTHLIQDPALAKKYLSYQGLGLRSEWLGLEKELISKETLALPGKTLSKAYDFGLQKMALSGEKGLDLALKIKKIEESSIKSMGGIKKAWDNKFVAFAELKRLKRPASLGVRENDIVGNILQLDRGIRYGMNKGIDIALNLRKEAEKAFGNNADELVTKFLESPVLRGTSQLTAAQKTVLTKIDTLHKQFATSEMSRGLLKKELPGYLRHILTPEAREYLEHSGKVSSYVNDFQNKIGASKERFYKGTIKEINDAFKTAEGVKFNMFESDPFKALAVRYAENIKATKTYDFIEKTAKHYGVSYQTAKNNPGKYFDTSVKQINGRFFEKPVAELLDSKFIKKEKNKGLELYDYALNRWKYWQTLPFAAYHFQNLVGGIWNARLGQTSVSSFIHGGAALTGKTDSKISTSVLGRKYTESEMLALAGEYGVKGQPGVADITQNMMDKMNPSKIKQATSIPYKVAGATEDFLRYSMFRDRLLKGDTPEEAVEWVMKHQMDYSPEGLSDFENTYMRRIFPFYRWTRGNMPLQAEYILKEPGQFATLEKYNTAATGDQGTQDYNKGSIVTSFDKETGKYTSVQLPAQDIFKLLGLGNIGNLNTEEGARQYAKPITDPIYPLLKWPIEQTLLVNTFTGKPYEKGKIPFTQSYVPTPLMPLWTLTTGRTSRTLGYTEEGQWGKIIAGEQTGYTKESVQSGSEMRDMFGYGMINDWSEIDERVYQQSERFNIIESGYQENLNQINTPGTQKTEGMNEAVRESLRYEAKKKRNLKLLSKQIRYVRTALNSVTTTLRDKQQLKSGLDEIRKKDKSAVIGIQLLQASITDLTSKQVKYFTKLQELQTIRTREENKHFELPNQRSKEGQTVSFADIGMAVTANRPGSGPELMREDEIISLIDLRMLLEEYRILTNELDIYNTCYLDTGDSNNLTKLSSKTDVYETPEFKQRVSGLIMAMIDEHGEEMIQQSFEKGQVETG